MHYEDIFGQVIVDSQQYEFAGDLVSKETVMRGFIRHLWADKCTNELAELSTVDMPQEEKVEMIDFLSKARATIISGEWGKASACIRDIKALDEALEAKLAEAIEQMIADSAMPFDIIPKYVMELPFVPIQEEEYETDEE